MLIILYILIGVIISVVTHVTAMAAGGWLVGGRIEELNLFSGPKVIRTFGDTKFSLGFIPLGGFVKFDDLFQRIHPVRRVFAYACGCLALVLVATACTGCVSSTPSASPACGSDGKAKADR